MTLASMALICMLNLNGTLVYDSGEPALRADGYVPFMDMWRVLDPLDNLCVRVITPITLDKPVQVQDLAFYSFNPKDPADKIVDIYQGTDEQSPGTLLKSVAFTDHEGVTQGWARFHLTETLQLPPGKYGIAFHASHEFHSYWAGNAPRGAGYAWVRLNDTNAWVRAGADDFCFTPNFAVRLFGAAIDTHTRGARAKSLPPAVQDVDTNVPGNPPHHEYQPGTSQAAFHVVWRQVASQAAMVPAR
jgi:hypothetical protein